MMNFLKAAVLSAALVAAGAVTRRARRSRRRRPPQIRGRFRRIRRPRGLRRAPALGSQRRPIQQRRIPVRIPRATRHQCIIGTQISDILDEA